MRVRSQVGARWPAVVAGLLAMVCLAQAPAQAGPLFDRVGIGADWGPHWARSPTQGDPRDTQSDGAFPTEVCLLRNAGFNAIRLYDATAATWLAVLDAVDDYNHGKLNCNPDAGPAQDCSVTGNCMSVVYQAAICGPDPRSLAWNGAYEKIGDVKCYDPTKRDTAGENSFKDSVDLEMVKLRQVIAENRTKFADHVSLVLVGNEILFSRGTCSASGNACSSDDDCGNGGSCTIAHYCSDQLTASTPPARCSSSASCGTGASCTDVTNVKALDYAFDRVKAALPSKSGVKPPVSISLQVDVLAATSLGDPTKLMYSRQLLADALPDKIIAANAYPDQWGKVLKGQSSSCAVPSLASCVGPQNAVYGQALLPGCTDDPVYRDPVTQKIAHTIDNYTTRLNSLYPGFELMIAETGWHTSGTCSGYNDCTSTYSPQEAATYYQDLYKYVREKQVALLAFEIFDERTKTCKPLGRDPGVVGEANYGLFTNFCQLKGNLEALLPTAGAGSPGPNLAAFKAMLDDDTELGGKSCRAQALVTVNGVGNTGVCEYNTNLGCLTGYDKDKPLSGDRICPPGPNGGDNRCVWGYCKNAPTRGCNPYDPDTPPTCGACVRSGNCYNTGSDAGVYAADRKFAGNGYTYGAACQGNNAMCLGAMKPFTSATCGPSDPACGCYVAMAPATLSGGIDSSGDEAPGFWLTYAKSNSNFTFTKKRTLFPEVVLHDEKLLEVTPVWGNVFLGKDWVLTLANPDGTKIHGDPCPAKKVSTIDVSNPLVAKIGWSGKWTDCKYPVPNVAVDEFGTHIVVPRGFLDPVPLWKAPTVMYFGF